MSQKLKEDLILYAILLAMFIADVYFLMTSPWYEILIIVAIIVISIIKFDKISDNINCFFRTNL